MKLNSLRQLVKEELTKAINENTPKYKEGDTFNYMGTKHIVVSDDGYIVKAKLPNGKVVRINYGQLKDRVSENEEENNETSSIETLEDAITFLNNNKQNILQIADQHIGDVQGMQKALNDFLHPYIENTPEFIVNRIKSAIGGAISKRNIQSNPELSQTYDKLKNIKGVVK
jgi:hypothetical protein